MHVDDLLVFGESTWKGYCEVPMQPGKVGFWTVAVGEGNAIFAPFLDGWSCIAVSIRWQQSYLIEAMLTCEIPLINILI